MALTAGLVLAVTGAASAQTFTADQLTDSAGACTPGACSLREAVLAANAAAGDDTILLADGVHRLTIPAAGANDATSGDLNITGTTTVTRAGAGRVTVDATGLGNRVFATNGFRLIVADMTITGGTDPSGSTGGGAFLVTNSNSLLRLERVTVRGNSSAATAGAGGVRVGALGTLEVVDSTISGNSTTALGGGINIVNPSTVRISSSTITGNTGDSDGSGAGVGGIRAQAGATVTLANSVVAGNAVGATTALGIDCQADDNARLVSGGHNVVGAGPNEDCPAGTGDVPTADAGLGPLADNGGATDTHLPLAGSPAVDAGDPAGCREVVASPPGPLIAVDQRPVPRQGRCDAGAAEAQPDLVVEAVTDTPDPVTPGGDLTYAVIVRNQGAGPAANATASLTVPAGVTRVGASGPGGACTVTLEACPLGPVGPGATAQATFTVRRAEVGTITVGALVSTTGDVRETDIANNARQETTTIAVAVVPPPGPGPDPGTGSSVPAPPPPATPAPPALSASAPLVVGAPRSTPGRRGVVIRITCPRRAPRARCTGTVRLETLPRARRARPVRLASRRYLAARGRTVVVVLALNPAGRRLAALGPVRARVVVTPDGRGARAVSRAIRI
ncbi:MAG: hypothetical protein MUE51_06250 [Thermoleophilia bacterium]|nr:hypothetical protein [Thermoleophilia bacterium]